MLDSDTIRDVLSEVGMASAQPQYSRREVNEAGANLLRKKRMS